MQTTLPEDREQIGFSGHFDVMPISVTDGSRPNEKLMAIANGRSMLRAGRDRATM